MSDRDKIYAETSTPPEPFRFDARVARVFADMVERSVPGYALTLELLSSIAHRSVSPGSRCYDLGCSLGASTLAILRGLQGIPVQVVGVDNSAAMLEAADRQLRTAGVREQVELRCEDIRSTRIDSAAMVVMNFTLQFVPLAERLALMRRIATSLQPGGVLVLSEKLQFEAPTDDALLTELHHEFKRQRGYSELEIAGKRAALEDVLVPESLAAHRDRLQEAGFSRVTVWLQCFNFVSLLARR